MSEFLYVRIYDLMEGRAGDSQIQWKNNIAKLDHLVYDRIQNVDNNQDKSCVQ